MFQFISWFYVKILGSNATFSMTNAMFSMAEIKLLSLGQLLTFCPLMESIRLDGPAHEIVTKTVHKTLPEDGRGPGGGWMGG